MKLLLPHVVVLLPLFALLGYWQWQYSGYVKDDTFISMRYARNLAMGHGLVFNYGDRLEGYTNFLWVVLTVPAFWLKVDVLTWVKGMSCIAGHLGIIVTYAVGRFLAGGRTDLYGWLAALAYAMSPTIVLWSVAGMESTFIAVLCGAGSYFGLRLLYRDDDPSSGTQLAVWSALFLAAGALCRPDAHAVIIVAGAFAVADAVRRSEIPRAWVLWGGLILAILIPYHSFRVLYFGDLFPNTAYVKASTGPEVIERGLGFVRKMAQFGMNPVLFSLAGVGLVLTLFRGPKRLARLWIALLGLVFAAYMVRIARDELKWFRLFLPVFPMVVALAGDGLRQLARLFDDGGAVLEARLPGTDPLPQLVARNMLGVVVPAALSIALLWPSAQHTWNYLDSKQEWHSAYTKSSEASFQAMGRYIAERSDVGDVAVFQDMGATPWASPDVIWLDTIGILSREVGRELSRIQMSPLLRTEKSRQPGGRAQIKEFEKNIRNHIFEQEPDWMAFVAYVSKGQRKKFRQKYNKLKKGLKGEQLLGDPDIEKHFLKRIQRNRNALGLARDSRFKENYEFVRVWKRDPNLRTWGFRRGYWLVLYRSKDHSGVKRSKDG
ncbi:MAG: hypothetical protein CL928_04050 [Deltaproteobacteria bacterium]|nr:hypothetical protein [Deltaproteobacteria bacterium]